jgi:hypothetical protein
VREDNAANIKKRENNAAYLRKWVAANREYSNARRRQHSLANPDRRMLNAARRTAKAKGLPFNLTLEDIVIPAKCPVLGINLEPQAGERAGNSPSLDRIVPALGYVKGNVVVVSWRANLIKCDATIDELERVAAYYKKIRQQKLPLD